MVDSDGKIRIAFVKFAGLSAGGTERWLQMMAANLPREVFEVDYYYCDAAPYVGSDYRHSDTDTGREQYMREHQVNLIKFHVQAKDITTPTHEWLGTDFWDVFDAEKYHLVQTAKAGPAEYPYHVIRVPVVEYVALLEGVDLSPSIIWSIHASQWQRTRWLQAGGKLQRSSVIHVPAFPRLSSGNLRSALGIPERDIVAGFHQRADNNIYSPIPLEAFARVARDNRHFVLMGGGDLYRNQARSLRVRNIHFVEKTGDDTVISQFLNSLDIFAHGRKDGETFGTVFAEAMMHGKPCLSHRSKNGANAHYSTMGPAGFFASDLEDYLLKLEELFSGPVLRSQLSAKAVAHAQAYYSLEVCVEKLCHLYHGVLSRPGPTRTRFWPADYGESPLGFLYAGNVDDPASTAHHVMTGSIPDEFDLHIFRFFLPHVKTLLDVGANTGLYCFVAAHEMRPDAVVHAFEPLRECCETMAATIHLNNWEGRVFVHRMGLVAPGELTLHLSGTRHMFDNSFNDNSPLDTRRTPVDTLDNQVSRLGLGKVDFIRVAVEGFEKEVLEGAQTTIERDKPVLLVEIADGMRARDYTNPKYVRTLERLHKGGYRILRINEDNSLRLVQPNQNRDNLANYLCVHEQLYKEVASALSRWRKAYVVKKRRERIEAVVRKFSKTALRPLGKFGKATTHPVWAARRLKDKISEKFP